MENGEARRLQAAGSYGWWSSLQLGAWTDIILSVTCFVCLITVATQRRVPKMMSPAISAFFIFCISQGIAAGCAACAHMMIHHFVSDPYGIGTSWQAPNSSWMFPWLLSMFFTPLASSAVTSMALGFNDFRTCYVHLPLLLGLIVACFEASDVLRSDLSQSGVLSLWFGAVMCTIASIIVCNAPHGLYLCGFSDDGRQWLQTGCVIVALSYIVILAAPEGCRVGGDQSCPVPRDIGEAVLHLFMAFAVTCFSFAMQTKASVEFEYASAEELKRMYQPKPVQDEGRCRACTREVC